MTNLTPEQQKIKEFGEQWNLQTLQGKTCHELLKEMKSNSEKRLIKPKEVKQSGTNNKGNGFK